MRVEQSNPKFNFLRYHDDPYRPYYIQKINELSGVKEEKVDEQPSAEQEG